MSVERLRRNLDSMSTSEIFPILARRTKRLARISGFEFEDSHRFIKARATAFGSECDLFEVADLRSGQYLITDHRPNGAMRDYSGNQTHYLLTKRSLSTLATNKDMFGGGFLDFPVGIYGQFTYDARVELTRIMLLHEGEIQIFASHKRDEQSSAEFRSRLAIKRLAQLFNKIKLNST